jgi:hypothetical protein
MPITFEALTPPSVREAVGDSRFGRVSVSNMIRGY